MLTKLFFDVSFAKRNIILRGLFNAKAILKEE